MYSATIGQRRYGFADLKTLLAKDDLGLAISDIAPPVAKPYSPWLWAGAGLAALLVLATTCRGEHIHRAGVSLPSLSVPVKYTPPSTRLNLPPP